MSTLAAPRAIATPPKLAGIVDVLAHGGKPKAARTTAVISMMAFAIMNVTTIVSLRGMPSQAEYGLTSIFYYVFAAVVFLIPVSLVAAELASTFPNQGGVFRWVGEAFGPRWGFAAIYYQWQAIVIWFPTVLIFAAAALAYIWWPQSFERPSPSNKLYTIVVLLAVYWFVTLFTFRGIEVVGEAEHPGRLVRHDHSRRHPHPARRCLRRDGQADPSGARHRLSSRLQQLSQHGARRRHISLFRRHGDAGGARSPSQEPFARLPAVGPDRDRPRRRHLRAWNACGRRGDPQSGH